MNTRKLPVSSLLLVCVLLSACAPATPMLPSPTVAPPTQVADTASPASTLLSEFPEVGEVLETVPLPVNPNRDSVYAFDSLWLPNDADGTVTRWDPAARQVLATITVGDPNSAPYGDPVGAVATVDSIWVTSVASREIVSIDPGTNQITERIPLGQVDGRDFVTNVMIGDDNNLWVWDYDRNITLRLDLKTKQVVGTLPNVAPATVADDAFWAWDSKHFRDALNLLRIDPATDEVVATIPLDSVNNQNASSENSIWLPHGQDLVRIDPQTNQVVAIVKLGTDARAVKFLDGSVWVTASPKPPCDDVKKSFLMQIDPATNSVVGKTGLDCPGEIFQFGNTLWVYSGLEESNYGALNAVLIRPNE